MGPLIKSSNVEAEANFENNDDKFDFGFIEFEAVVLVMYAMGPILRIV